MPRRSKDEVSHNFASFMTDWRQQFRSAVNSATSPGSKLEDCYRRIAVLNSWRIDVLSPTLGEPFLQFFLEFQNDALQSLVFASAGAWRPALQSLRSGIEDALHCLYYKDHPVEYRLWEAGRFKIGFAELSKYLEGHPDLRDSEGALDALARIKGEYGTLSRAVHGHRLFRMTGSNEEGTVLFSKSHSSLGAYRTRQAETTSSIATTLAFLFHEQIQGTRQPALRKVLKPMIPPKAAIELKRSGVHI